MDKLPPQELAVRISKIINRNKEQLKAYQDKNGNVNFNLLIGLVLGGICSFGNPALNQILKIFFPIFNYNQLRDYGDLMMGLNNYLVDTIESSPNNIYLLENNKWTIITEAGFDSVYALWYAFFCIMKVEFEHEKDKIDELKSNPTTTEALRCYTIMHKIMTSATLDSNDLDIMQTKFPEYTHKFNELRKLIYTQSIKTPSTVH
jgi:acyl-CoA-binding protein